MWSWTNSSSWRSLSFLFCMSRIWRQALYVLDAYPIVQCSCCYKKSCFTHQLPWHEGLTCSEFDSLHPELAVDQEAAQHLISATTQQCTKCKKRVRSYTIPHTFYCVQDFCLQIERSAGCDHMTCEPYFIWEPRTCNAWAIPSSSRAGLLCLLFFWLVTNTLSPQIRSLRASVVCVH